MHARRLHLLIALAVLLAAVAAGTVQRAGAATACSPCVILIQVDGLEPKDITPQKTPVLWAMGHKASGTDTVGGRVTSIPGFSGRNGFTWQAPRGVMSAGTAPSTAALLTGGYPEQSGVPADDYLDGSTRRTLAVTAAESGEPEQPIDETSVSMLPELIKSSADDAQVAAFVGDPGLAPLVRASAGGEGFGAFWTPNESERGNPAYCTPPREPSSSEGNPAETLCPAADMETMNQAVTGLTGDAQNATFSFIHLAGVGAAKRVHGDLDHLASDDPQADPAAGQQAVEEALSELDQAVGQFVGRYSNDANGSQRWPNTVVFVVGSHGYELTPVSHRVPDPAAPADPGRDLARYVKDQAQAAGGDAVLIPQGSFATVYYRGSDPAKKQAVLADLKAKLTDDAAGPNSTDVCRQSTTATPDGRCILEVNYVRSADAPEGDKASALDEKHPGWHLDSVDKNDPTNHISGDLVVTLGRGWAVGDSIPVPSPDEVSAPPRWDNPFNGSGGGPRNRAVAMLVNGPESQVAGWEATRLGGHFPVAGEKQDELQCDANPAPAHDDPGPLDAAGEPLPALDPNLAAANADPGDDANAPGHECQAESVDVAPTIAALLKVGLPSEQIAGRFLQEAFSVRLGFQDDVEDPGQPEPDPEPAPPPVPIEIPPPPPPPPPPPEFDFYGLVRNLTARVTDSKGCTWSEGRNGAKFSNLKIEGDFGKELAAVTLTFYTELKGKAKKKRREARAASARWAARLGAAATGCGKSKVAGAAEEPQSSVVAGAGGQVKLKTVVRFQPFTLQRGHVELKLLVPDQFRPDHVGVVVQEAKRVKVKKVKKGKKPAPGFEGFGPKEGGVFTIKDAKRLHQVKRAGGKRKGGKRRR